MNSIKNLWNRLTGKVCKCGPDCRCENCTCGPDCTCVEKNGKSKSTGCCSKP